MHIEWLDGVTRSFLEYPSSISIPYVNRVLLIGTSRPLSLRWLSLADAGQVKDFRVVSLSIFLFDLTGESRNLVGERPRFWKTFLTSRYEPPEFGPFGDLLFPFVAELCPLKNFITSSFSASSSSESIGSDSSDDILLEFWWKFSFPVCDVSKLESRNFRNPFIRKPLYSIYQL